MKRNIIHILWMAAVLPLALLSCSREELPGAPDADGTQKFTITVTDCGYYATASSQSQPQTRIAEDIENDYETEFTDGDVCGLYIVRNGKVVIANAKLTASASTSGITMYWTTETELKGGIGDESYFLYYPYVEGDHKVNPDAENAEDFFAPLIAGWQPAADQSSFRDYTASDLMISKGMALKSSTGANLLWFFMYHRMALAVIEMPKTVYKFTNTTGGKIPDYTAAAKVDFANSDVKPYYSSPGKYRYIVNPKSSSTVNIKGAYAGTTRNEFRVIPSGIAEGCYKSYLIDGAETNETQHNLQRGDFLMKDGTLLSKGTDLTAAQKANVAAIVFWSPAETNPEGRKTPASLSDDKILVKDFPYCTHGLAIALNFILYNNDEYMNWQKPLESVQDFLESANFTHPDKHYFTAVGSDIYPNDNINRILGYQNTQVMLAYNAYCAATEGKSDYVVRPVAAINEYAKKNPAPAGSTGWYLPSAKESYMFCLRDIDDISTGTTEKPYTRDIVNASLTEAGGDVYLERLFWSSTEHHISPTVYTMCVRDGTCFIDHNRKDWIKLSIRAVCAF